MSTTLPSATTLDNFVNLSALLTGIERGKLAPPLDPVDIKQTYFDFAKKEAGSGLDTLLSIFAANAAQPAERIADLIFKHSGPEVCFLARSIILMWYLGSWYAPRELQKAGTNTPPPNSVVISAKAYTQGWAWKVAQAHPMGYSDFQFGYWSSPPPALDEFVGQRSKP